MQVSQASLPCQIVDQKPFFSTLFPGKFIMWRLAGLSRLWDQCFQYTFLVRSWKLRRLRSFFRDALSRRRCAPFLVMKPQILVRLQPKVRVYTSKSLEAKNTVRHSIHFFCFFIGLFTTRHGSSSETFLGKSAVLLLQKSRDYINFYLT